METSSSSSGRLIERIYDATKRCKLFVSTSKISIRFKIGITPSEEKRVESFLLRTAEKVNCDTTVRGHVAHHEESDTYYIVLKNESRDYSLRVSERDLEK